MKLFQEATKSASPSADCAAAVLEVVPAVMRQIRRHMRGHSASTLSVVQFRALAYLSRNRGATLSDVAEHIGLTLPSASKLVQSLQLRGYLNRQTSSADRRKTVLTPTARGIKIHESARAATRKELARQLGRISARQRQTIIDAMASLGQVFREESCRDVTKFSGIIERATPPVAATPAKTRLAATRRAARHTASK